MTNEELDEARAEEAMRLQAEAINNNRKAPTLAIIAARLAREGWAPPPPVDPDVLAFREWASKEWPLASEAALRGHMDTTPYAAAYLAGARMAREQEREAVQALVEYLDEASGFLGHFIPESAALKARNILAAYKACRAAR
jgi:hypothetical protein